MVAWFQALMPKQGRFFEQFEAHAATLVAGADALQQLFSGDGAIAQHIAEIEHREHEADDITRAVLQDVRRVFVTPFDRSAITDLISGEIDITFEPTSVLLAHIDDGKIRPLAIVAANGR